MSVSAPPVLLVPTRPARVTAAVVLVVLAALGDLLLAAGAWYASGHPRLLVPLHLTAGTVHAASVAEFAIGVGLLVLAVALARGSGLARGLVTLAMVVRATLAVLTVATIGTVSLSADLAAVAGSAIVLGLLWNRPANAYFLS